MSHLTYDLDKAGDKVRTFNVFMSFVKNDKLVERLPCISHISEKLEQHNEEAKRLIFFDEFIPEIDDDKSARTNDLPEVGVIVDIFGCEV